MTVELLPPVSPAVEAIMDVLAPSKLSDIPENAAAGNRNTTTGSTNGDELADQGPGANSGESTPAREAEQPGVLRRIWHFVKGKFNRNGLPSVTPKLPPLDQSPPLNTRSVGAGNRIAERQRKRAITTATLTAAQNLLTTSGDELSEMLVLRVTELYANLQYVRAIDLLNAKAHKEKTVLACNEAGERIPFSDTSQRRSLSVYDVLAAQIELVPLPRERRFSESVVVTPATDGPANEGVVDVSLYEPPREITPDKTTEERRSL